MLQDGPVISLPAGATLSAGTRVTIDSSGEVQAAAADGLAIGYLTERGAVSGEACSVRAARVPAMWFGRAHSSLAIGAALYSQAAGRVDDVNPTGGVTVGIALTAASAQDDIIIILAIEGALNATT